ncbi:hypothetical protein ABZ172_13560 [Streptomyces sp. NPDC006296]|uniref:hypothetical protein n=1 Tax=Streptomyces sp. NPDC006296 TaxID=3156746 RepID=UPI0033B0E429
MDDLPAGLTWVRAAPEDAEAQLQKYRTLLSRIEDIALAPERSRDFVHTIGRNL